MKLQILFVDDEQDILNGLRRALRKQREGWQMSFALSGEDALEEMEAAHFDIIVTDMRMPGMDGAELLEIVRERHPHTVRIILSGYSEEDGVLRTIGPAHRYLAKPCPPEILVDVITEGFKLREFISNDTILEMVNGLGSLPSPAAIVFELQKELDSPKGSKRSVADIISHDIALTTQVMRLTNSAFFSLPTQATTPLQAVTILGFDTIRSVLLISGIFSEFDVPRSFQVKFERLSMNSLAIGKVAKALSDAEGCDTKMANDAQCAGTLSHLGSLVLMALRPDEFLEAAETCEHDKTTIYEVERKLTDVGHAELGAYLLGLWGFADSIVAAVAYHHAPGQCNADHITPLTFVHAAQYLCKPHRLRNTPKPLPFALDEEYLARVGVIDKLPKWDEITQSILSQDKTS